MHHYADHCPLAKPGDTTHSTAEASDCPQCSPTPVAALWGAF